jgi:Sel1 repeat
MQQGIAVAASRGECGGQMLIEHRRKIIIFIGVVSVVMAAAIGYQAISPHLVEYRKYLVLREFARRGDAGYQELLAEYLYDKGDDEEALKWEMKAAEGGNALAQNLVGTYYAGQLGHQLPPQVDYTRAREWFEKAAAQELQISQYELCSIYHRGQGVEQDEETAYFWCSLSEVFEAAAKLKQQSAATLDQEAVSRVERRLTAWKESHPKNH